MYTRCCQRLTGLCKSLNVLLYSQSPGYCKLKLSRRNRSSGTLKVLSKLLLKGSDLYSLFFLYVNILKHLLLFLTQLTPEPPKPLKSNRPELIHHII